MTIANGCVDGASMKKSEPPDQQQTRTPEADWPPQRRRRSSHWLAKQTVLAADTVSHQTGPVGRLEGSDCLHLFPLPHWAARSCWGCCSGMDQHGAGRALGNCWQGIRVCHVDKHPSSNIQRCRTRGDDVHEGLRPTALRRPSWDEAWRSITAEKDPCSTGTSASAWSALRLEVPYCRDVA